MRTNRMRTRPATAVALAMLLLAGCASSGPTELLTQRPEPVQPEGPLASPQRAETVTIDAIELAQNAGAARIAIKTTEALVWTTYRDESGQLVVELPNSRPDASVAGVESEDGIVSALDVRAEEVGGRPLTRLVIATTGPAEHSVRAAAGGLEIALGSATELAALDGVADAMVASAMSATGAMEALDVGQEAGEERWDQASEVVEEQLADGGPADSGTTVWEAEPAVETASPVVTAPAEPTEPIAVAEAETAAGDGAGWIETPTAASGQPATELRDIDVVRIDNSVVVRILGDGEFSYQTLSLEAPYRYVIDLEGVANFAPRSTYSFGDEPVEQVRVAQFKSEPPVSRVVIDLAYPATPELVGLPDGLALSFGGATAAAWSEPADPVAEPIADSELAESEQVYEAAPAAYEAVAYEAVDYESAVEQQEPVVEQYADLDPVEEPEPIVAAFEPQAEEEPASAEMEAAESMTAPAEMAPVAEAAPIPVNVQFAEGEGDGGDSSELFNSRETDAGGQKVYRGEPITLHLKDADIRDLLRSFSEFSGLNFVIQPGVTGTVTVQLTDVPWDQALDLILKTNDLGYELEGNILRVAPLSKLRDEAEAAQRLREAQAQAVPLATVIKRVSYATADEVAQVLQSGANSILSRRGSVIIDARTNTLIIKELPNFIDTVIAVIETLDIPEPQVMIEARIIETTKRFSRTLGINWGFDGIASAATGNTTGLVFPNNGAITGDVGLAQAGTGTLGVALGNVLDTFRLDVALQAAESEGLINILSAPRITTLNNESAQIQSGLQIPIQTVANNTVSVQFVNATLSLQVTPHVTAEGTVLMDIDIQKREPLLAFAVAGSAGAPISTKDARTRVIVRDGGTTVIGGIYEVTSDEGQDRVPGLSKVPFLKHFFKNSRQSEENEELLIFITPRVVKL